MPELLNTAIRVRAESRKQETNRNYFELKPLRFTVRDVSTLLRCTKPFIFKLIKTGHLKAVGSKRKVWVTAASLEQYLDSLPDWRP